MKELPDSCIGCNLEKSFLCQLIYDGFKIYENCPCVVCLVKVTCMVRCEKRMMYYVNTRETKHKYSKNPRICELADKLERDWKR